MRRRQSPFFTVLCLALPMLALWFAVPLMPGCVAREEVAANRASIADQKTQLDGAVLQGQQMLDRLAASFATLKAQADQLQVAANDTTLTAQQRASAQAAAAAVATQLATITQSVQDGAAALKDAQAKSKELGNRLAAADATLAKADSTTNSGTTIGAFIASLVPGLGAAAIPILGLGARQLQLKRANDQLSGTVDQKTTAISNIVTSIDALASVAPEVAAAIDKHKGLLDAVQKASGKSAVDQVQAAKVGA